MNLERQYLLDKAIFLEQYCEGNIQKLFKKVMSKFRQRDIKRLEILYSQKQQVAKSPMVTQRVPILPNLSEACLVPTSEVLLESCNLVTTSSNCRFQEGNSKIKIIKAKESEECDDKENQSFSSYQQQHPLQSQSLHKTKAQLQSFNQMDSIEEEKISKSLQDIESEDYFVNAVQDIEV